MPMMTMPDILDDVVILQGGLDLKTPNLQLKPGHVRSAQNWQCVPSGGYERVGGYERFDGKPSPSGAPTAYTISAITLYIFDALLTSAVDLTTSPDPDYAGTKIYGGTSGAVGLVSFVVDAGTDLYNGKPYIAAPHVPGLFQVGETITAKKYDIAGNEGPSLPVGVLTAIVEAASSSAKLQAQLLNRSADVLRSRIGPPPGSGRILGVASLVTNGIRTVYSWRNNAAGTAAVLYRSSASGWVAVPLYHEVRFTHGGQTIPLDGAILTQGSVNATVKRVVLESGDWLNGTAAGRLIVTTPTPSAFLAGEALLDEISVTLTGPQTAITLDPNGRYECQVFNFYGQLRTRRLYGVDGVNRAFEFDGDVLVPIETKAAQDIPKHLRVHQFHLFLAIGSSWMISGPGVPYEFATSSGGKELAVGDDITGALVQPGSLETAAMASFARNSSGIVYGSSGADWTYKAFPSLTGAIPYMQQNLEQSYVFDDRGVMSLAAAQEYGNFTQATLSANIDAYINQRKSLAIGSCVSVDRSQFRMFFSDGSALYTTIVNGKLIGHLPQLFIHPFSCVWSSEDESGNEETFAGGQNGTVYQLDRGSSFDGEPIDHHLILSWNYMRAPRLRKQLRKGSLEVASPFFAEFNVGYSLSYGSTRIFQASPQTYESNYAPSPTWDNFVWDAHVWDGVTLSPSEIDLKGKSECLQMAFSGSSDYVYPFTLNSLITHYTPTRRIR